MLSLWTVAHVMGCAAPPSQDTVDEDGDGYPAGDQDCDDLDPSTYLEASELCDGKDNDCDGEILEEEADDDGDGFRICDGDCMDDNANVYPGAEEICDALDNNCNGAVVYPDWDQDGDGVSACMGDCEDEDPDIHPGAVEWCDEIDNNCNGAIDEGPDADGDGSFASVYCQSQPPDTDCDDSDPTVYPGADDPPCDGVDTSCSGSPTDDLTDDDGDQFTECEGDCDDGRADVYPGVLEVCNDRDDNCDGVIDEGLTSTFYGDHDGDGYGADDDVTQACGALSPYVSTGGDCDDRDELIYPGAAERCNYQDDDCDGVVDDGLEHATYYHDLDGDGHGDPGASEDACGTDGDLVVSGEDCDDAARDVNPDQIERCEGIDNDCNGLIDDDPVYDTWYSDIDGDGFGTNEETVIDCVWPMGYAAQLGDCDDDQSTVHPDAPELCDGLDNNCDGHVDDDPLEGFFRDRDGDGFGDPDEVVCAAASGYLPTRGDCDDGNPDIYPGAADLLEDGIDQDCGGTDGPQPHVGLSSTGSQTLAEALGAGLNGDVIWVGPGTYLENSLSFAGKNLALRSTHFAEQTIIDGDRSGRVFQFNSGEGPDAVLDGFTIRGGFISRPEPDGAGIRIEASSPTIRASILTENFVQSVDSTGYTADYAPGHYVARGAGAYVERASPRFLGVRFLDNEARDDVYWNNYNCNCACFCYVEAGEESAFGGGIYATGSSLELQSCTFEGNHATEGGALLIERSEVSLRQTQLSRNDAVGYTYLYAEHCSYSDAVFRTIPGIGGGALFRDSVVDSVALVLTENGATIGAGIQAERVRGHWRNAVVRDGHAEEEGGGLILDDTSLIVSGLQVIDNVSETATAGGLWVHGGAPFLYNLLVVGNTARRHAGMLLEETSAHLKQITVADNRAREGANGIYADSASFGVRINRSILARNGGKSLWVNTSSGMPPENFLKNSTIFDQHRDAHNLTTLHSSNLELDPELLRVHEDGDADEDDFHLQPDSPVRGSESTDEGGQGGNATEYGVYGGSLGDKAYYEDGDGDGLYDGWEMAHGLNPASDDSSSDPDGDGLSNGSEQRLGTDPTVVDTDGDGLSDGEEVGSGADPLDAARYEGDQPVYRIPEDYPDLDAGIHYAPSGAVLDIASGTHQATLTITIDLTLRGRDPASVPVLETGLAANGCALTLEHLRLTAGNRSRGGGLYLVNARTVLNSVLIDTNRAEHYGGGIYAEGGSLTAVDTKIWSNLAGTPDYCEVSSSSSYCPVYTVDYVCGFDGAGAGLYLYDVLSSLDRVDIRDNIMDSPGSGGGIWARGGSLTLLDSTVVGNAAGVGNLEYVDGSGGWTPQPGRPVVGLGGGLYLLYTSSELQQVLLSANSAGTGGSLYVTGGSHSLEQVWIEDNLAAPGCADNGASYCFCEEEGGAGIYATGTQLWGSHLVLARNEVLDTYCTEEPLYGRYLGGAAYLDGTTANLEHIVAIGNTAALGDQDTHGPGIYLSGEETQFSMVSSGLRGDAGPLIYLDDSAAAGTLSIDHSALYNSDGSPTHNLETLPDTVIESDPRFLSAGLESVIDVHLALDSPLIDGGPTDRVDVDGSRSDIGIYGGASGDRWDVDQDGVPAYFWPGGLNEAPMGFSPDDFDANDRDAEVR